MPRKKKTEETKQDVIEELKQRAQALAKKIAEKTQEAGKTLEIEEAEEAGEVEEAQEREKSEKSGEEESAEEKPKKKREKKKLSEAELKRVMTDTKETLVPLTDYIACSIHLGTKVITPDMRKFVYKRRADGLAVLNTSMIDDKLREAIKFLAQFEGKDAFIACKREACWPAVEKFAEVTGIRSFTKKYPAGIITNIRLENFFEPKLAVICDPWVDKNALHDSNLIKIPVLGICDTNNYAKGVVQVIAGNNKSRKSIGIILFILARGYLKEIGKEKEAKALKMEDFTGKLETAEEAEEAKTERRNKAYEATPMEEVSAGEGAKEGV